MKAKTVNFYGLIGLVSYYFALFMALKTKAGSFYALIRHLLLVILLCFSFQKPKGQVFMIRSSCLQIFFKIGVLKNFANSQEHTCVGVSFNKIAGLQRDSNTDPFISIL